MSLSNKHQMMAFQEMLDDLGPLDVLISDRSRELLLNSKLTVIPPPSSVQLSPPTSPPSGTTPTKLQSSYQPFPFDASGFQTPCSQNFSSHSYIERQSKQVCQLYPAPASLKINSQSNHSFSTSSSSSSLTSPVSPLTPAASPLCPYPNFSTSSHYQQNQNQVHHHQTNSLSPPCSDHQQQTQQYFPTANYPLYNGNKNNANKNTKGVIKINNNSISSDLEGIQTFNFESDINNNTSFNGVSESLPPFSVLLHQTHPRLSDVNSMDNDPCAMQEDIPDMKYTELMKVNVYSNPYYTLEEPMDNPAVKTEPMDPIFSTELNDLHLLGYPYSPYLEDPPTPDSLTSTEGYDSNSAENEACFFPPQYFPSEVSINEASHQQVYNHRPNPDIDYNQQQYNTNGGHSSPMSDEGFVEGGPGISEENLPNFAKIQHPAAEAERPQQRRRSSASSPKERKKVARESPMMLEKERRKPGRKPGQVSNVLHLWEFMRDLLHTPSSGGIIEWISKPEGVFRVVNSTEVARLWGEKKKNKKKMTYEKLSRSLRYSRLEGYFSDLPKDKNYPKKLCFKFGPKSKDWH